MLWPRDLKSMNCWKYQEKASIERRPFLNLYLAGYSYCELFMWDKFKRKSWATKDTYTLGANALAPQQNLLESPFPEACWLVRHRDLTLHFKDLIWGSKNTCASGQQWKRKHVDSMCLKLNNLSNRKSIPAFLCLALEWIRKITVDTGDRQENRSLNFI